jgi:hypothetical protein
MHKSAHLSIQLRSMASAYNCVGHVFGSRRTVIDIDHVQRILKDDGYYPVIEEKAAEGDVVLYYGRDGTPTHIGILWRIDRAFGQKTVLSQWGRDGEFFHALADVMEDWAVKTTFWSERIL